MSVATTAAPSSERIVVEERPLHWTCGPNYILCRGEHLLTLYKTGFRGNMAGLSGQAFFQCDECRPSSFFFAVFHAQPFPIVYCYAIGRDSFKEWDKEEMFPDTRALLYQLRDPQGRSLNPQWRPAR